MTADLTERHADASSRLAYADQAMQSRFADLLDAQETGTGIAPVTGDDTDLATLRKMMADDNSPYWTGPNAKALQARMAELLGDDSEAEQEEEEPTAGLPPQRNPAGDTYNAIIDTLHPDERSLFTDLLNISITDEGAQAINAEFHRPDAMELTIGTPANVQELHEAAQTPDGAVLLEEWGADAAYKFALVRERLARIAASVSDEEADRLENFVESLSPGMSLAISRALARG